MEKIITVDFQIYRTSQEEGILRLGLNKKVSGRLKEMWILHPFIAIYDRNQRIESLLPRDTVFVMGKDYTETLCTAYQKAYNDVIKQHAPIELFTPDYFSFCDFQKRLSINICFI